MDVDIRPNDDGSATVDIVGEITVKNYRQLTEMVDKLAQVENPPSTVILNVAAVAYVDSVGLGSLIKMFTSLKRAKCSLVLRNVTPHVRESLEMTKLDKLLIVE